MPVQLNNRGSRFVTLLRRNVKTDLQQLLSFRVPELKRIAAEAAISGILNAHARIRKPHTMANDYTTLNIRKATNLPIKNTRHIKCMLPFEVNYNDGA